MEIIIIDTSETVVRSKRNADNVVCKYLKVGKCSIIISCYIMIVITELDEVQVNYGDIKDFNNPEIGQDFYFKNYIILK